MLFALLAAIDTSQLAAGRVLGDKDRAALVTSLFPAEKTEWVATDVSVKQSFVLVTLQSKLRFKVELAVIGEGARTTLADVTMDEGFKDLSAELSLLPREKGEPVALVTLREHAAPDSIVYTTVTVHGFDHHLSRVLSLPAQNEQAGNYTYAEPADPAHEFSERTEFGWPKIAGPTIDVTLTRVRSDWRAVGNKQAQMKVKKSPLKTLHLVWKGNGYLLDSR